MDVNGSGNSCLNCLVDGLHTAGFFRRHRAKEMGETKRRYTVGEEEEDGVTAQSA